MNFRHAVIGIVVLWLNPVAVADMQDCGAMPSAMPHSVECSADAVQIHNTHTDAHRAAFREVIEAIDDLKAELKDDIEFIRIAFIYPFWAAMLVLILSSISSRRLRLSISPVHRAGK